MADTSFHLHMEGCTDNPDALEYGLDAFFWRTSIVQVISSFTANRTSPKQTSPNEEEYRQIQASIHRAQDFQERMQRLDIVLDAPALHTETTLARLPRNMDPWPLDEIKPSSDGHPAYGETSRNPDQTSNCAPTVLSSRSVSSHPILSMARG